MVIENYIPDASERSSSQGPDGPLTGNYEESNVSSFNETETEYYDPINNCNREASNLFI
jgi:hypothetical protein